MKKYTNLCSFLLSLIFLVLGSCGFESDWAPTVASITDVEARNKRENGDEASYGYKIQYEIPASTAINQAGHKIKGPIEQYVCCSEKKPLIQKIKIEYMKEEPIFYRLIDSIKYEK